MKQDTKDKLRIAYDLCNKEERSTEYMLEYMQDFAGVDLDAVIQWLADNEFEEA